MDTPALLSNDSFTIYLNDHLAGATAGSDLAARAAAENDDTEFGPPLRALAEEIAEDRKELLAIMAALDCQVDHVKLAVGWTAEKLARLKPNGRVFRYSPLSRLLELEGLAAGIRGKRAVWSSLAATAGAHASLDATRLAELVARADAQIEIVDGLHGRAAELALEPDGRAASENGAHDARANEGRAATMHDPRALLLHELGDILYAENVLVEVLPRMAEESSDPELRAGFQQHLAETQGHIANVEHAFEALGAPARAERCPAIDGITEEHHEFIQAERPAARVRDIFLTGSGARIEHYEIAVYTSLIAIARGLGERECARLLTRNLKDEKTELAALTAVSKRLVGT